MKRKSLLCRSAVKEFALHLSQEKRAGKFTRVSQTFIDRTEAHLKVWLHDELHRHPSVGKTLQ